MFSSNSVSYSLISNNCLWLTTYIFVVSLAKYDTFLFLWYIFCKHTHTHKNTHSISNFILWCPYIYGCGPLSSAYKAHIFKENGFSFHQRTAAVSSSPPSVRTMGLSCHCAGILTGWSCAWVVQVTTTVVISCAQGSAIAGLSASFGSFSVLTIFPPCFLWWFLSHAVSEFYFLPFYIFI